MQGGGWSPVGNRKVFHRGGPARSIPSIEKEGQKVEKTEYIVQMQELLNLVYSTLDTLQAQAENLMDAVAVERAALDTLARPAFFGCDHHQTGTAQEPAESPETVAAVGL